ncbi:MAG: hypothetical protein Q9181_004721, partial [Wetmoreana brouardii]
QLISKAELIGNKQGEEEHYREIYNQRRCDSDHGNDLMYYLVSLGGEDQLRKTSSYHFGPTEYRIEIRVMIAAPRGIPKKTATLVATVE